MDIWSLAREGHSKRAIAKKVGLNFRTVSKYLEQGEIRPYDSRHRGSSLEPYHEMIREWLSQDTFTATRIHDLVTNQGFKGSYDVVKVFVRQVKQECIQKAFIRFETLPGQQAQVDFADFKVTMQNGESITYYCFSMILGYSRHIYAELVTDSGRSTLMDCHKRAFAHFGGVPGEILYDNLKPVVDSHGRNGLKINAEFADFALHYRFEVKACPPYAAWVKGKVEQPFKYMRERFWRGYIFLNLAQANADLSLWLSEVANQRIHGTHKQIVSERFAQEKSHLGELPQRDYDTSEKAVRKVYKDCQLSFRGNRYVVPHQYVNKQVLVKYKAGILRIYYDDELLVTYTEPQEKGHLIQDPRFYAELKACREQNQRKYLHSRKGKARAELFIQVEKRELASYEALAGGSVCQN